MEMFVWGSAGNGALALKDMQDRDSPVQADAGLKVVEPHIVCSGMHSMGFGVSEQGLWGWGDNQYDQIEKGPDTIIPLPHSISFFADKCVKLVSCGWSHTVVVTTDNQILTWGQGKHFQLGHGDNVNLSTPKPLSLPKNDCISEIACGWKHTMVLTDSGTVFGWGTNKHGQLLANGDKQYPSPVELSGALFDDDEIGLQIRAGWRHSFILMSSGRVLSQGCNHFGQRGVSKGSPCKYVQNQDGTDLRGVSLIDSGWFHGVAVCSEGIVKSWGKGALGELGTGETCNVFYAQIVEFNVSIEEVVCGSAHTFARTRDNEIFGWGWNEHGNIGLLSEFGASVLRPVQILGKCRYRKLISGGACVLMFYIE